MIKRIACLILIISILCGCGTSVPATAISTAAPTVTENNPATITPAILASVTLTSTSTPKPVSTQNAKPTATPASKSTPKPTTTPVAASGDKVTVHYLDVGQADSILVQSSGKSMLIDAGNNGDANTIINYLKKLKVSKIDYLVCTHPHEDHEGALDNVINTFSVGKLYMNSVVLNSKGKDIAPDTQTHRDVLEAVKNKKLTPVLPKPGTVFKLGSASCTVMAPISTRYDDLNDFSIVIKLTYKKSSWIFEGDAEEACEKEMLSKKFNVDSDVLKVGHHGSDSSTSDVFLSSVSPKYAVISVGKGNRFKHPYKATMEKLKKNNIPVYRTDENGTIVCTSDGNNISFNVKPGDYSPGGDR